MDYTFFPIFLPNPMGKRAVLASGCVVLGCWLGLNHNTEEEESLRRERWELMWLQKVGAEKIWAISTSQKITTKTSSWKLVEAVLLSSYSCCINSGQYKQKHHCPQDSFLKVPQEPFLSQRAFSNWPENLTPRVTDESQTDSCHENREINEDYYLKEQFLTDHLWPSNVVATVRN